MSYSQSPSQRRMSLTTPVRAGIVLSLLLGLSFAPLQAANRKAKDDAPVLMSKTGGAGGDTWETVKEMEAAAEKGNPRAETALGEMLLRGDGVDQDEARGVALLERAARKGEGPAAFRIGMLLAQGESGVAQDPVRALDYFRAAAAAGEVEAFFNIGAAYASARGVRRDYAEALGWLIVAQQRGAQSNMADALREQIKSRPEWIATGERRAKEIDTAFSNMKPVDLLPPPAPLDKPAPGR